jgi:hypothetical protein
MNKTTHLFANPSFIEGVARVLDMGTNLEVFNSSDTPKEADTKAIRKDWEAVGDDICFAINT